MRRVGRTQGAIGAFGTAEARLYRMPKVERSAFEFPALVERRSTAADRRQYAIYLTAEGRAAAEQAIALQHALIAATLGRLPSEKVAEFETLLIATRDLVRAYRDRETAGRSPGASS